MATVWIPAQLRELTHGEETVLARGATVQEILDALERAHPGMRSRLCDARGLRPGMSVVVDKEVARLGLAQPVAENSEVHFLPAISGG